MMLKSRALTILGLNIVVQCQVQLQNSLISGNPGESGLYPLYASQLHVNPSCKNFGICQWLDKIRAPIRDTSTFYLNTDTEGFNQPGRALQGRSYHSGYGAPATATYYPTFDPISVLASLAFLAFLLQSFASLFDRSRSILPTIVSSRQSSPDISTDLKFASLTKRVLRALKEYESLNEDLIENVQHDKDEN